MNMNTMNSMEYPNAMDSGMKPGYGSTRMMWPGSDFTADALMQSADDADFFNQLNAALHAPSDNYPVPDLFNHNNPGAPPQPMSSQPWQHQQPSHYAAPYSQQEPQPQQQQVPQLHVSVEGLSFQYKFTEDDVLKVFSRYGEVASVIVNTSQDVADQVHPPCQAKVIFHAFSNCMAAWSDLNGKGLAGIPGAFLRVDCPSLSLGMPDSPRWKDVPNEQPGKKYTCRLEVGIENDKEYRVGSKVIQIARKIWEELPTFQKNGGKTRLRGKGVGGPHESDEPLALCISCRDASCFEQAVQFAEVQIQKIHTEYIQHCRERGYPLPALKQCKAVCDHPHTTAPWHQTKYDHHHWNLQGRISEQDAYLIAERGQKPPQAPPDTDIERLIEERNEARKGGNFTRADEIRDYLKSKGVVLMDDKGARGNKKGVQVTKWRYWNP